MATISSITEKRSKFQKSSIPSYTITYSQPRLTMGKPANLIWEKKEAHFTATDNTAAYQKMCEILGQNPVCFHGQTYTRELEKLVLDHPRTVIRETKTTNQGRTHLTARA